MMESPFLPGDDASFRYQVTTTPVSKSSSGRNIEQKRPTRRLRAWEKSTLPVESSIIHNTISPEPEHPLETEVDHSNRCLSSLNDIDRRMIIHTPLKDNPSASTSNPTTRQKESRDGGSSDCGNTSTTGARMYGTLYGSPGFSLRKPKKLFSAGTNHSSSATAASGIGELTVPMTDTEEDEDDLGTPVPSHPEEELMNHASPVSPRKLVTHFTITSEKGRHSLLREFLSNKDIRLVAFVTCMALLMDVTWVLQTVTPTTKDVIISSSTLQSSSSPDSTAVLCPMDTLEKFPSVADESVAVDTVPDTETESEVAFSFYLAEEENYSELSDTDMKLATKAVPDLDDNIMLASLGALPGKSVYPDKSLRPRQGSTEDKPKGSSDMLPSLVATSVALSDDGDIMAIAGANTKQSGTDANTASLHGLVRVFSRTKRSQIGKDISLGAFVTEVKNSRAFCFLSLSPDGTCMVTGWSSQIRLYQKTGNDWVEDTHVHLLFRNQAPQGVTSVAISADCHTVVVAADSILSATKRGTRWSMKMAYQLSDTTGNRISGLALSADALRLAVGYTAIQQHSGTAFAEVQVLNRNSPSSDWLQSGQTVSTLENQTWSRASDLVSLSSDGSTVAIGSKAIGGRGEVRVYAYNSIDNTWNQMGSALFNELSGSYLSSLSLSSNGKCVAIRDVDGLFMSFEFEPVTATWSGLGDAFYSRSPLVNEDRTNEDTAAYPTVALSGDCQWVVIGDPKFSNNTGVAHMFQL